MQNCKFDAKNEDEARKFIDHCYENGAIRACGFDKYHNCDRVENYWRVENNTIFSTHKQFFNEYNAPLFTFPATILKADFSNARVGDRVKCITLGAGVVTEKYDLNGYCIFVEFDIGGIQTYTIDGRISGYYKYPTLFYHFDGQFPTSAACTRPEPDAYELHGVTREQVSEIAKAASLVAGFEPRCLTWSNTGKALFWDGEPQKDGRGWKNGIFCKVYALRKCAPYPHWQTPIILKGVNNV